MIAVAPQNNGTQFKSVAELLVEEVSASRLKRWSTCRLQFYFHYVAQIKKPATPALAVGKVVHAVLQEWNKYRWRSDSTFRGKLDEVFKGKWGDEQIGQEIDWDGDEEKQKLAARGLIELYLDQTPIKPTEKPSAVEVQLEADLGKHGLPKIIGFIDLVRPGGTIVDFKTSAQTPNADAVAHQNEIQLTWRSMGTGTFNFDNGHDQRLQTIQNKKGSTQLSKFDYTYNGDGTLATWITQTGTATAITHTLTYDAVDQLVSDVQSGGGSVSDAFNYDPAGNRLTETLSGTTTGGRFNSVNQLMALGTTSGTTTVSGTTTQE